MTYTYFCKKGGVGKTTITGEHATYLAQQGKRVLVVSIDDQNSLFEMFGCSDKVFERDDNYLEHYCAKVCSLEDTLIPLRDNLYAIKTLNTDMLSKKLTLERAFEKQFLETLQTLIDQFDAVFFDLPPSSNRTSELVLEIVDMVILVVQLNKLGVNGFYNTLQYFVDASLDMSKIKFVLPNGFSKIKSVPTLALEELKTLVEEHLDDVTVLPCIYEKACIQTLQVKGITVFDVVEDPKTLSPYEAKQKAIVHEFLEGLYNRIPY